MKKVAAQQLCPRLAYLNDCDGSPGEPRSFDRREALGFLFWNSEGFKRLLPIQITGTGYIGRFQFHWTIQIPKLEVDTNHWTYGKHNTQIVTRTMYFSVLFPTHQLMTHS